MKASSFPRSLTVLWYHWVASLSGPKEPAGLCRIVPVLTRVLSYLSLSASTLSMSSGSSLGSLASSRGSLNTSSRGSLNSLSSSELYYTGQGDQLDVDYQYKLDFLLQEKGGYIPSGPITTIHEHEVVKSPSQPGQSGPCGAVAAATGHAPPLSEAPKSVASLSSRSSLSSLSPPGSPLVLEGTFPMSSHDVPLHQFAADFEDCELSSRFADLGLGENQLLLDSDSGGVPQSLSEEKSLPECAREPLFEGPAGKWRPCFQFPLSHGKEKDWRLFLPWKQVVPVPLLLLLLLFSFWLHLGVLIAINLHISSANTNRLPHLIDLITKYPFCCLVAHFVGQLPGSIYTSGFQIGFGSEIPRQQDFLFKVGLKQIKTKAISVPAN